MKRQSSGESGSESMEQLDEIVAVEQQQRQAGGATEVDDGTCCATGRRAGGANTRAVCARWLLALPSGADMVWSRPGVARKSEARRIRLA